MDSPFLFIVLAVILAGEAIYLAKEFLKSLQGKPQNTLLLLVLITSFVVVLPPVYYVIFTDRFEVFQLGFPLSTWCLGLTLESVFYAVFIATLKFKRRAPLLEKVAGNLRAIPKPTEFLMVLLLLSMISYVLLWGPWSTADYEAAGNYIHSSLSDPSIAVAGIQSTILNSVLFPSACVLLFYAPRRKVPIWMLPLLWSLITYVFLKALASGGRGFILADVFAVSFCLFAAGRRFKPIVYIVVCFLCVSALSPAVLAYRQRAESYVGFPLWEKARIILNNEDQQVESMSLRDWVEKYMTRLDAGQDGGILADHAAYWHDFASFRPFIGAVIAPMPRYLWKDKPLALSDNNAVSGLPWYSVMEYRGEPWNNGGVSTSGIAYWQFGWLGVILTAVFVVLAYRCLAALLIRGGPVGLLFFLSFCMTTHFRFPVAIDEMIFAFMQILLPISLLLAIHKLTISAARSKQVEIANRGGRTGLVRAEG